MKRFWNIGTKIEAAELFIAFIVLAFACVFGGCGGLSGDPDRPLGADNFGYHYNPVAIQEAGVSAASFEDQPENYSLEVHAAGYGSRAEMSEIGAQADSYYLKYATRDDFAQMRRSGDWVVSNLWKAWWDDPVIKPHLQDVINFSAEYGMKLIVRLEDQSRYSNYPVSAGGPKPTDEAWFQGPWTAYVAALVEAGRGKAYAYQIWNEMWEPGRFMTGPDGTENSITAAQYATFLERTRNLILSKDPSAVVVNGGLTSITESFYNSKTKQLLPLIGHLTDAFNFHAYNHIGDFKSIADFANTNLRRVDEIGHLSGALPWCVTEANNVDNTVSDDDKFRTLNEIYEGLSGAGKTPQCFLAFCYNEDAFLRRWTIQGTELEAEILEAWGR